MTNSDLVQSVMRCLDILEIVASADEGVTLQELAQALAVASPTAHNLARTLLARGYLEKSSRPTRYRLGPAAFALVRSQSLRLYLQRAGDVMQRLALEIPGATVTLAEARGGEVQVVLRMSPELPGLLQRPEGMLLNAYVSAHALVFQAFWTETERAAYRRRYPFDEFGAHAWSSQEHFDRTIAEVRLRGYALPTSATGGLLRVAIPILSTSQTLAASLGISLPQSFVHPQDPERLVAIVMAAARQVNPPIPSPTQENPLC
jgi:DNA-binding IclR family transcriptional regulator